MTDQTLPGASHRQSHEDGRNGRARAETGWRGAVNHFLDGLFGDTGKDEAASRDVYGEAVSCQVPPTKARET